MNSEPRSGGAAEDRAGGFGLRDAGEYVGPDGPHLLLNGPYHGLTAVAAVLRRSAADWARFVLGARVLDFFAYGIREPWTDGTESVAPLPGRDDVRSEIVAA